MNKVDCIGYWDSCSAECGTGTQKFRIITNSQGNGAKCATFNGDQQFCKKKDCDVNCEGKWGDCTQSCGGGKKMFTVTKPKEGNGWPCMANDGDTQHCNTHNCNVNVNCQGNWEPCSASCGEGTQKYKITTIKQGNGSNCKSSDNSSQSCKIIDCFTPANCVLDDNWGPCTDQVQRKGIKSQSIGTGTCADYNDSTRKRNC